MTRANVRDLLRSIKTPKGDLPEFDTDTAPDDPIELFDEWLASAVEAEVSQPNAMVLATASAQGVPGARTLLLKDVTAEGFWFASLSSSPKGANLEENPNAALVLYWREQGRQVRVQGSVRVAPREVSEEDFQARHPFSRAQAIAGEQSLPMPEPDTARRLMKSASNLLDAQPRFVPDDWNAYIVEPQVLDFWQAAPGHDQIRLRYHRGPAGWEHLRVWP